MFPDAWTALRGLPVRAAEDAGLITRAFALADVERMILDGTIKDATTIAAMGLLRMKGLI